MNYTFENFSYDEMKDLLILLSNKELSEPITANPKHFSKYIKGFRANKLPQHILYKIYYDEISKFSNSPLGKYLINIFKSNISNTKIEELIDEIDDNIIEVAAKIEEEIRNAKLFITPVQILKLAGYKIDEDVIKIIDRYSKLISREKEKVVEEISKRIDSSYKNEITNIKNDYAKCIEELKAEKEKGKKLTKSLNNNKLKIEQKIKEQDNLKDKYKELTRVKEKLEKDVVTNNKKNEKLYELESQVKLLMDKLNKLEKENKNLKIKVLTAEDVKRLSYELLEDLRIQNISDEEFINYAKEYFSDEETINESWHKLNSTEIDKLSTIVEKMGKNIIVHNDIITLDEIENCIHYKYIIIKGLKILFYEYLEQQNILKTIEQNYK